jgi:hypothetical protein
LDLYCHRCGEPWETDSLHEVWDEERRHNLPYPLAVANFKKFGCGAMENARQTACATDPTSPVALMARAAMSLSDHPDDWASDLSELRYLEGI